MKLLTFLLIPFLFSTNAFSNGAGDAAFSAFMSTLVMPGEQNPCIGLKKREIIFKAEDIACAAMFQSHGRKCILVYKKRKVAVNRIYCQVTDFATLSEIYPSKKEVDKVMRMKKTKFRGK